MLQFEELRLRLLGHEKALKDLSEALGLQKMKAEIVVLEEKAAEDGFWDDLQNSQAVLKRTSALKSKVSAYEKLCADYDDALVMIELSDEEGDLDLLPECEENVKAFESNLIKKLEVYECRLFELEKNLFWKSKIYHLLIGILSIVSFILCILTIIKWF